MAITRPQVTAALAALGLDPHLTHTVTITPTAVQVAAVALEHGRPVIRHGLLGIETTTHPIEEDE